MAGQEGDVEVGEDDDGLGGGDAEAHLEGARQKVKGEGESGRLDPAFGVGDDGLSGLFGEGDELGHGARLVVVQAGGHRPRGGRAEL